MKRIAIGQITEIGERRSRTVRIGELEIALFKLSDGTFRAVENRCPHKGGKLSEGIVCDHHVFCPLHDWKINLSDGLVQSPDEGCVTTFEVEVDEASGTVWLHVDDEHILVS